MKSPKLLILGSFTALIDVMKNMIFWEKSLMITPSVKYIFFLRKRIELLLSISYYSLFEKKKKGEKILSFAQEDNARKKFKIYKLLFSFSHWQFVMKFWIHMALFVLSFSLLDWPPTFEWQMDWSDNWTVDTQNGLLKTTGYHYPPP